MKNNTFSVATFNIEWFGKYEKDYVALFSEIRGFDVVGVQEITDAALFQRMAVKYLGKNWKFAATDYPTQKVGLLFKGRDIKPMRFEKFDVVNLGHRQRRPGFLGEFKYTKTGFIFEVMVVHLKSGSRKKDVRTRQRQWKVLAKIFNTKNVAKKNVVLLGDMNSFDRKGEDLNQFQPFVDTTGFLLATAEDPSAMTVKCGGRIDHIFVSPALAPRLVGVSVGGACRPGSQTHKEECSAYWKNVSDHCPVSARFNLPG
ncbi:MAG TPA: endonuclease/exonuclease/phosphatase family protein [Dissulfurispiraceae bacterium]|nr:endonuclease/exonuclease/phosphatase family protein [Dissulfurispiraceae bacterium]